jgi:uncharacterized membrane protein YoaK (UPF0700 family)
MVVEITALGSRGVISSNGAFCARIVPRVEVFLSAGASSQASSFRQHCRFAGRAGFRAMLDSHRNVALACALSALAGYVDGIGFLHLGGLFVSFMSGNSTQMGVHLANGHWHDAAEALGLIVLFVIGAAAGSLIALGRGAHRQPRVLLVEALLLATAALCYGFGLPIVAVVAIVLAMGVENAVFQVDGSAGLGLTYVTGALVKTGQRVAAALTGGSRWGWAPSLLLWATLVAGAVCGALAYQWINLAAVWFAAGAALALSGISAFLTWSGRR